MTFTNNTMYECFTVVWKEKGRVHQIGAREMCLEIPQDVETGPIYIEFKANQRL
jgi:hypothetical protein